MTHRLRLLTCVAATVLGSAVVPGLDTPAQARSIPVFLAVQATGLTVTGSGGAANLYAWASCGGEFAAPTPTVEVVNPATTTTTPAATNLLYGPAHCNGTQPVSEDIAVYGAYVYWVSADGHLETDSSAWYGSPTQRYDLAQRPPLIGGGVAPGVAVDDHAITWTSSNAGGMGVYAVAAPRADGTFAGDPRNAYESAAPLRHLSVGPFGTRLVVSGTTLLGLTRSSAATDYSATVLSSGRVTAVASDPGAVYWAEKLTDGYVVYTRRVSESRTGAISYGTVTTIKRVTGMATSTRVSHIVVDPNTAVPFGRHDVWWSVEGTTHATDPTLAHFIRSSDSFVPLLLHSDTSTIDDIATDGGYVYWTDSAAVYRVLSSASPPHALTTPLNIEDDSPDLPFADGTSLDNYGYGADPGGRVTDIVIDPTSSNKLYAATQYSGPWRSTDGGRSWRQSAHGMSSGGTDHSSKIAIDPASPSHLLYATNNDGSLAGQTTAALYASTDSGVNWTMVSSDELPCQVYSLAFADGTAWASGGCGLYYSSDLFTWHHDSSAGVPHDGAFITASGKGLYACDGGNVDYKLSFMTAWTDVALPSGHCFNLYPSAFPLAVRAAPDGALTTVFVVHQETDTGPVGLTELHLIDNTSVELGYPDVPRDNQGNIGVSGELGVWVGNHHSGGYRLFTANGDHFFELDGTTWDQFDGIHWDARALAFPPAFDPVHGNCTAYVASDGAVDINRTVHADGSRCATRQGPWVRAQHGLHAFKSGGINGVHRASCETPSHAVILPCPVLYVGAGDNGMWTRDLTQGTPWDNLHDCCGDNGGVIIDPKLPHQLYATRNAEIHFYNGHDEYVRSTSIGEPEAPPNEMDQAFPASPSGATVVMSTTSVPSQDTKIALERFVSPSDPDPDHPTLGTDQIVISRNGGGWRLLGTLPVNSVQQLAASGGNGSGLVLYLRRTDGTVDRSVIGTGATLGTLNTVSPAGANVSIIWANPYDSSELWIENDAAHDIERSSSDGAFTWTPVDALTSLATGYDPRFGTGIDNFGHIEADQLPVNSLEYMWFPDDGSGLRIALTPYGGPAISRDGGHTWIPLGSSLPLGSWLAHPWSLWYDAQGSGGVSSDLYLALAGRGVMRVNANFDALVDVAYIYCPGGTCPSGGSAQQTVVAVPTTVSLVDEASGQTIPMTLDADGNWRATELLDATGRAALHYHFVVDGVAQASVVRQLTTAERRTGVVNALPLGPGPDPGLPSVGPMTVSPKLIPGPGCASSGQKLTVSAQVTTAAKVAADSATLTVEQHTYDETGDVQARVLEQVPMTASDVSTWTASFQLPDLTGEHDDQGAPSLIVQVEAATGAGTALGNPASLGAVSCPKVGSKPPGVPQNLTAKPARGAAQLNWRAPVSSGGDPITGYEVAAYHSGRRVAIEQFGPRLRSGSFTGLSAHTGYAFAIRARNLRGPGPWSPRTTLVIPS